MFIAALDTEKKLNYWLPECWDWGEVKGQNGCKM